MSLYRHHHDVRPWKGEREEIVRLAVLAQELVEGAQEGQGAVALRGKIEHEDRETDFNSIDQLVDLAEARDDGLRRVAIWISARGGASLSANVYFDWLWGASANVEGTNRVAVAGIFKQLERELDHGRRRVGLPLTPPLGTFILSLTLSIVGLALILGDLGALGFPLIGLALGVGLTTAFLTFVIPRFVPPLEFISADDHVTRADVAISRAKQAGLFLAGSLATALIIAAVDAVL